MEHGFLAALLRLMQARRAPVEGAPPPAMGGYIGPNSAMAATTNSRTFDYRPERDGVARLLPIPRSPIEPTGDPRRYYGF